LAEDNTTILTEFNAASKAWPSSTRMELLAVLTLVSILPQDSKITIRTDSNNVITKFEKFKGNITFRRKIKENNLVFWEVLFEIIKRFNIKVIFQKVKAHSGDKYNDRADALAKLGCNMDRIDIDDNVITERARLFWFDHCIDKNIRQFIKEVNNQRINIKLESLNRMKDLVSIQQNEKSHIDVDLSMIVLTKEDNNDLKPKFLSIKQDKQKAFRIKKLFNELPVMEVLKIRKPQVYKSNFLCS